ncbi:MAG: magnesium/cobalt transporter CorA [Treponema sp.]|jgi:magnesium transporter|nr:magnesium/cobalt transporter CorA [Treponema sp.]
MDLSLIGYDPAGAWLKKEQTVEELLRHRNSAGLTWINMDGLDKSAEVNRLAEVFRIHPLTVEDILDANHRPKVEEFDDYIFIVLKSIGAEPGDRKDGELYFEQISLVVTEDTVISFQEKPGDYFDGIRKRILNNAGRIRRMGTVYLAWAIMDAVVDRYFVFLDAVGGGIEEFEERAMDEKDQSIIPDIQKIKRTMIRIRRAVWPLRENIQVLMRLDSEWIPPDMIPFFKDLHDNVIQAADSVETYRELIAGVIEVNLSAVSNRLNNVMKVLTIISTIFIPLTFIVGVYGMNFKFMPELEFPLAYPVTWAVMVLIAVGMLIFFKIRRWL